MLEALARRYIANPLRAKIWKGRRVRVFTDGGEPTFFNLPRAELVGSLANPSRHYHPDSGLYGFCIQWLGRQFWFVFGEDKRGCFNS